MSAWGPIPHCPNVVTAEALGLLYGLRAALPLYAGPIQVESDNSFLVNEVKRNESSKSLIAGIVQDIKIIMTSFQNCHVSKINRKANSVADGLAKEGHNVSSECVVLGNVPLCVVDRLKSDCNQNLCVQK
jgi:ribonuclease HI